MSAEQVSKLQSLLARVISRKDAPRVRSAPQAAAPPSKPAAFGAVPVPQPAPPSDASRAKKEDSLSAEIPMVRPAVLPATPRADGRDLPDLDLVDGGATGDAKRPTLIPSTRPGSADGEAGEFELAASAGGSPSASVAQPVDIELAPGGADLEISHEPLASALPPRTETPRPMAAIAPRPQALPPIAIEANAAPSPTSSRFESAPAATTDVIAVRSMASPSPRTFRGLVACSLALRPKR